MTFKYGNIKIKLYLQGRGSSKTVARWRCACFYRQALKNVCKILHHFVPLSCDGFLNKQVNRILPSTVFLFFRHRGFLGCARVIFLKRDKIETQLAILGPCRGHALKTIKSSLLWYHWSRLFSARNESGDIIKKCTEISRISSNIIEIYQRCNHKNKYVVIHDFY